MWNDKIYGNAYKLERFIEFVNHSEEILYLK